MMVPKIIIISLPIEMETLNPEVIPCTPMPSLDVRAEMDQEEIVKPIPPADDTCWRD